MRSYKYEFFNNLLAISTEKRAIEQDINKSVRVKSESLSKSRNFDTSDGTTKELKKYAKFYQQNLKIKAFYTLLKYARKRKQVRGEEADKSKNQNSYLTNKYFKMWRQAYSHKMNMLENRKCFKVKFSDY